MMRSVYVFLLMVVLAVVSAAAWAVSPNDPARTCKSANGKFTDKTGDGQFDIEDWRVMDKEEKRLQVIWNLETMCREVTPGKVKTIADAMDRLGSVKDAEPAPKA